jgi:hypothetical protein
LRQRFSHSGIVDIPRVLGSSAVIGPPAIEAILIFSLSTAHCTKKQHLVACHCALSLGINKRTIKRLAVSQVERRIRKN